MDSNSQQSGQPQIQDTTKKFRDVIVVLLILILIFGACITYVLGPVGIVLAFQVLVIPFMILVGVYAYLQAKARHAFFKQYAALNGFTYSESMTMAGITSSYLLELGHNQGLWDVVTGSYNNVPLRLYEFKTTIGSGKGAHPLSFTVFEMDNSSDTLDVVIVSKKGWRLTDEVYKPYQGMKYLELEGDFNKYFLVYVPDGYEIEALEILTPDIMQELMNEVHELLSFEFHGNKLYIFASRVTTKKEELDALFAFSEALTTKLAPVLATIKV